MSALHAAVLSLAVFAKTAPSGCCGASSSRFLGDDESVGNFIEKTIFLGKKTGRQIFAVLSLSKKSFRKSVG
ncbi:MAG: hypothetical protein ACI3YH_00320, partial [Eubacteriales bacterium]